VTWEELVVEVTARYPVRESKMFGMPCLKRENGKVVAGYWKDGGITVKLTDEAQREAALALPGAAPFDPGSGVGSTEPPKSEGAGSAGAGAGMGRPMREWVHVPAVESGEWQRLVEQAIG
jgi:hypothetical protein